MYKNLTISNKAWIKRFSHSKRFEIAVSLLDIQFNDTFLDYGTGDGYLLFLVKERYQNPKRIIGYEPIDLQFLQLKQFFAEVGFESDVEITNSPPLDSSFSKISCLEVLEHMTASNQMKILGEIRRLMSDDGLFLVSVPIEIFFSGLIKNIIRIFLRQTHSNATLGNIIKSTFGFQINRPDLPYISSHIGFNHKKLEAIFSSVGLRIEKSLFSPWPYFGGIINSQVFYLLRKN